MKELYHVWELGPFQRIVATCERELDASAISTALTLHSRYTHVVALVGCQWDNKLVKTSSIEQEKLGGEQNDKHH